MRAPPTPRFQADAMLAGLAKWLRVLGFDTALAAELDDASLVTLANRQSRILLTRDRHLYGHLSSRHALLILPDDPLAQLRQVIEACEILAPAGLFTRCLRCNTPLVKARREVHADALPASVRATPGPLQRCPTCRRLYWYGSHARRMHEALAKALPGWMPKP